MLADILKSPYFNTVFSVLCGLFLAALLRPVCKGVSCIFYKQPPTNEIRDSAYKLGNKCYKFTTEDVECPSEGVIEPFAWSRV